MAFDARGLVFATFPYRGCPLVALLVCDGFQDFWNPEVLALDGEVLVASWSQSDETSFSWSSLLHIEPVRPL